MIELRGGNRTFCHIPKTYPPIGKKTEFDTDSMMVGKANQTQTRKVVENKMSPTITHADSTQEIKTEPIPVKRLGSEQETTPQTQEEKPWSAIEWIANERARNDWGVNWYGWGIPMPM